MKNMMIILALAFCVSNAFAQSISDIATGITLSPFVTATKMMETSAVGALRAVQSSRTLVQARGVGGKEQLKDELVALNEAMIEGNIHSISDIQQTGLRELFEEIMADKRALEEVTYAVQEGPVLFRVATVVTITLLME